MEKRFQILVVDDEEPIRGILQAVLQRAGYAITTAATKTEAETALELKPLDLVLLDLRLGEDDGLEFLEEIHRQHPALPVVLLSGLGDDDVMRREAEKKGAAGILSKGGAFTELYSEIKRVLEKNARSADKSKESGMD